jgi:hypothetical protein
LGLFARVATVEAGTGRTPTSMVESAAAVLIVQR